jgi:quercetin dioxygenase-like cupin family protein
MAEQPLINVSETRCVALADETRFEPNGIVSRTLLRTPGVRAVLFGFAEGQELTEHSAPYHALVQALEGQCEFTVNGQVHALKPGDWLSMPPQAPHALKAVTRFSMLLILIPPAVSVTGRS